MKNLKQTKLSFYEKMNEIHECALYLVLYILKILSMKSSIHDFEMFSMNNLAILRLFYGPKYSFPFFMYDLIK